MAFIMVVLLIHLVVNVIGNKTNKENKVAEKDEALEIKHPAEFLLR
jgi:hypothetical protein